MKDKPVPAWKSEPLLERLQRCRAMLYHHGYLGDQENFRVLERIDRAYHRREKAMIQFMQRERITRQDDSVPVITLDRNNRRRDDGLSSSLQIAKAAEHLVCAELILQGWNVFAADAGLPYDLVIDIGHGSFCRIQVKATCRAWQALNSSSGRRRSVASYRFALRRSRTGDRRISLSSCDFLALVALDIRTVGFLSIASVMKADGMAVTLVEMKSRTIEYIKNGRSGVDPNKFGRFIEDYRVFDPTATGAYVRRRKADTVAEVSA